MRVCGLLRGLTGLVLALALMAPLSAAEVLSAELQAVRTQLRDGKLDEATTLAEALVQATPQDTRAWTWLGRAYGRQAQSAGILSKGSWAGKCRDAFIKAVALDGSRIDARTDLMQFYAVAPGLVGGSRDKAEAEARAIAALDPVAGHVAVGQLHMMLDDDIALAEKELRTALGHRPADNAARLALSQLLGKQERWADAFALWDASLALNADDALAHYSIGRLAALSGQRLQQGLAYLDRYFAAASKPEEVSETAAHWRKGLILEKLGQHAAAAGELRLAAADAALSEAKKDLARVEKQVKTGAG